MRRALATLAAFALIAACSRFGPSDPARSASDGGAGATSDARTDAPVFVDAIAPDAGVIAILDCTNTPPAGALFCDDFESTTTTLDARWSVSIGPDATSQPRIGTATVAEDETAPSPSHALAVTETEDGAFDACLYSFVFKEIEKINVPRVHASFSMRLDEVRGDTTDFKTSVMLLEIRNKSDTKLKDLIQDYLYVSRSNSTLYDATYSGESEDDQLANPVDLTTAIPLHDWVHIDVIADASSSELTVKLNGAVVYDKPFSKTDFGGSIAKLNLGLGYPCTAKGGAAAFDDVLITTD